MTGHLDDADRAPARAAAASPPLGRRRRASRCSTPRCAAPSRRAGAGAARPRRAARPPGRRRPAAAARPGPRRRPRRPAPPAPAATGAGAAPSGSPAGRADDRGPARCSTWSAAQVAAVLGHAVAGRRRPDRRVHGPRLRLADRGRAAQPARPRPPACGCPPRWSSTTRPRRRSPSTCAGRRAGRRGVDPSAWPSWTSWTGCEARARRPDADDGAPRDRITDRLHGLLDAAGRRGSDAAGGPATTWPVGHRRRRSFDFIDQRARRRPDRAADRDCPSDGVSRPMANEDKLRRLPQAASPPTCTRPGERLRELRGPGRSEPIAIVGMACRYPGGVALARGPVATWSPPAATRIGAVPRRPGLGPRRAVRPRPGPAAARRYAREGGFLHDAGRLRRRLLRHLARARRWRWTRSSGCCWRRPGRRSSGPASTRRRCAAAAPASSSASMYHDYASPAARRCPTSVEGYLGTGNARQRRLRPGRVHLRAGGPGGHRRHRLLVVAGRPAPGRAGAAQRRVRRWRWPAA